jgi:TolB protein
MKADGTRRTVLTRDRVQDFDPAPSPDGRAIAFASIRTGRRLVYVRSADGRERRLVARRIDGQGSPAWSPDGRELAIEADGAIYVVSAVGGPPRRLVAGGEPAWSPDGKRLAFFGGVGGRFGSG